MTLNQIKDFNIQFKYNDSKNNIENINEYLKLSFQNNNYRFHNIYNKNKVFNNIDMPETIYKIEKIFNEADLNNNILNLFINLTGNAPIKNTLLICNEDTNLEEIKAFFFRVIFFLIFFKEKIINSVLIILYIKNDSGLSKDIRNIIPDKYDFIVTHIKPLKNDINIFKDIEVYISKFFGYRKTIIFLLKSH